MSKSSSQYPRGVPFKPPVEATELEAALEQAREREAQLKRWMLALGLGTVGVVVLALSVGGFFLVQAMRQIDRVAARADKAAVAIPTDAGSNPPAGMAPTVTPPKEEAKIPKVEAPAGSPRDRSLEAIGGLTGAHMYQSYLNLGMLADAAENEVYTEAEATKLLSTISTLMDTVDGQLNRLAEANPDPDDLRKLAQVRAITGLLRLQAKELRLYWETEEKDVSALKDHQAKFHKAREDAWVGIKDMLGIQE